MTGKAIVSNTFNDSYYVVYYVVRFASNKMYVIQTYQYLDNNDK